MKSFFESFCCIEKFKLDKALLSDLRYLTKFLHTGSLEVYHSSYNKRLPRSTHFSYQGMIACSQLAAIEFKLCSELSQAEIKTGEKRFNVAYSKATDNCLANLLRKTKIGQFLKICYDA